MSRGRKPDSNEIKRARGITRPSRLREVVVDFPKPEKVPSMPIWATYPAGVELWQHVAPLLHSQGALTLVDVAALAHLCQLHCEVVAEQHIKQVRRKGIQIKSASNPVQ